ncbi:MAG: phosphatidylserine/phosphatidylglycerophosphate/cardiolipin synthase family protein [Fibrobacter sp.]|nr:phosphatidylserine/phosphatidylglycerophosphate/cardiolipin synthase family protein [Fibrobacter sp.]
MIKTKTIDNASKTFSGWNREKQDMRLSHFNTEHFVCDCIDEAEEMVCITTFLLADRKVVDAVKSAANRGARIYLLIASENTLEKNYESEDDFSKKCIVSHIMLLDELSGKIFIRSAPSNHAKFVFIDPYTNNAKGYITTGNFTDEGIGGRNEEMHYALEKKEVDVLANYFKHAFWNCAKHEMRSRQFVPAEKMMIPVDLPTKTTQSIVTSLDGNKSLHDACLSMVKKASKSLVVSAFGFDNRNDIVQEIAKKAKEGVKVIVLSRIRPKNNEAVEVLHKAGATVYGFRYLHAKCIIADDSKAIMMTANFEDVSFYKSFEVGALITEKKIISAYSDMLNNWIENSGWRLYLNTKLGNLKGEVIPLKDSKYDEKKEIVNFIAFECGKHSPSLELLQIFEPQKEIKNYELMLSEEKIYCSIQYTWECEPPHLEYGSIEKRKKREKGSPINPNELRGSLLKRMQQADTESYNPKIFTEPSGRMVVAIQDDSELEKAIELKKKMKCEAIVYEK